MADFSIRQGEDMKVLLPVVSNGTNVNISACPKIMAALLIGDQVVKNYSLTPEADYGTLEVDGTNNWQVNLFILRAESKSFPIGVMSVVLLCEFTDETFPSGTRTEQFFYRIGRCLESKGIDLNM